MSLELVTFDSIREGLKEQDNSAYSMKQNMVARMETPVLEDRTDLWKNEWLDSKDINFYGRINDDKLHRFKMDHEFSLNKILNAELVGGAVPLNKDDYSASKGAEFIILSDNHAIRADKYQKIRNKYQKIRNKLGGYSYCYPLNDLGDGVFKINLDLIPEEIIKYDKNKKVGDLTWKDIEYVHDGWLEHAVGKNNVSKKEYLEAAKLLAKYVSEAEGRNCFRNKGVGFYIVTNNKNFGARPWYVGGSDLRSNALDRHDFFLNLGRFLRVRNLVAAEGGAQKIVDTWRQGKEAEALKLMNDDSAATFLNLATAYYTRQKQ